MKTKLVACPWMNPKMTEEAQEAIEIIEDEVWKEASILFASEREAKQRVGKTAPKGMQRYLNDTLAKKFTSKGWIGGDGYFFKEKTWIRATFRHQMSLGSDILDAIKVCKKEGIELAII